MAGQLGTALQMAAVGPQDEYLFLKPEMSYFDTASTQCSQFASEPVEDPPLQPFRLGKTNVFLVSRSSDMLGDMHLQISVPAVQPLLGTNLPPFDLPDPDTHTLLSGTPDPSFGRYSIRAHGLVASHVFESSYSWVVISDTSVVWYVSVDPVANVIRSTALADPDAMATLSIDVLHDGTSIGTVTHAIGRSAAFAIVGSTLVAENDAWPPKLAYLLMKRVRLVINDLIVHSHERLWYDVHDTLMASESRASALPEMLGVGCSMAVAHTLILPFKFLCCRASAKARQTYFPSLLVPSAQIRVEFDAESLAACVGNTAVAYDPNPAIDALLISEHVYLSPAECNSMISAASTKIMYETEQDMENFNYVEFVRDDGTMATINKPAVTVDLSELNLPVKYLAWVMYADGTQFQYVDVLDNVTLAFGSQERESGPSRMFSAQQPWSHAVRAPATTANVGMYAFCLDASSSEPCGAADFAVIKKPVLRMELRRDVTQHLKAKVFGVTYNWLQFSRGTVSQVFV
jgi:hypothetical protein